MYMCNCLLSLSIYFQSYNSFPPVSIYCAYCLFMYVHFSCCPLRALNWSINWIVTTIWKLIWNKLSITFYPSNCKGIAKKYFIAILQNTHSNPFYQLRGKSKIKCFEIWNYMVRFRKKWSHLLYGKIVSFLL